MGSDSLFFIIIAICLIMSAYFSATETGIFVAEPDPHEKYGRQGK